MTAPLTAQDFSRLMAPFEPFESAPVLACAVSGGADSLALTMLLDDWARSRAGRVVALTVDHRLRPDAGAEAEWVGSRCAARAIEHHVLPWRDARPSRPRQAAAREARYGLLTRFCAERGILHLAVAHHREDQAETMLLRLGAGSGPEGLAGMAAQNHLPSLRLLRPLLGVAKARLRATLREAGVEWVEDPSNLDEAHTRIRLRRLMPALAREGLGAERLAMTARRLGEMRATLETLEAHWLAKTALFHPAGCLWLSVDPLREAPDEVAAGCLARVLRSVGGARFAPRTASVRRLLERVRRGLERPATLGGCRLLPRRGEDLLIVREAAACPNESLEPGRPRLWDGRFSIGYERIAGASAGKVMVGPLGPYSWREAAGAAQDRSRGGIPLPARAALPALHDLDGLLAIPHLSYVRPDRPIEGMSCALQPRHSLGLPPFTACVQGQR